METIGDAYLIVSGLPNKNGTKHVTEMAELAFALRKVSIERAETGEGHLSVKHGA